MKVTADQVRDAALAAGVKFVESHPCSFCGVVVGYHIRDGELYFDSGCDCCYNPNSCQPRDWQSAADWINMQSHEEHALRIAKAFGLELPPTPTAPC